MTVSSQSPPSQNWSAPAYAANAHFVPALGQPVLDLLHPQPGERILDLGCGDGVLTEKLVALGARVIGIDSSAEMIAAARLRGIDARLMDARSLMFENEFDAIFSNAALHWVKDDTDSPIAGAFHALVPGGRFVGELGGHGCVGAITVALMVALERRGIPDAASWIPWYFPTVEEYETRLRRAGFVPQSVQLIPRPTPLPTGMRGWLETFASPFCAALSQANPAHNERNDFLDEVTALLKPVLCDSQGRWTADYMRLRFVAIKT
ncbi:MAG TPA: methyltransferase domain-containing protein [Candidatus Sulfotelmatobacter sp.]